MSVDNDTELDGRVVSMQVAVEPGSEFLVLSWLVACCSRGRRKLGTDSTTAAPQLPVPDHDEVRAGSGDRDVPELRLPVDPVKVVRKHIVAGYQREDYDIAFAALKRVNGTHPNAVAGLVPADVEPLFQVVALGGLRSDDANCGLRRELRQQLLDARDSLGRFDGVEPRSAVRSPDRPPLHIAPADGSARECRAATNFGEHGELSAVEQPVRQRGDLGMAAVVLVEHQAAAADGALGGVEGGVASDGLAVLVDPGGADPVPIAQLPVAARRQLADVRQLHDIADNEGAPGAEQQWNDVRDWALAGLVDDDEVEQRRAEREAACGLARHRPAADVRQDVRHPPRALVRAAMLGRRRAVRQQRAAAPGFR